MSTDVDYADQNAAIKPMLVLKGGKGRHITLLDAPVIAIDRQRGALADTVQCMRIN